MWAQSDKNGKILKFGEPTLRPPQGTLPSPKSDLPPVYPLDPLDRPLKKNFEILGGLFDPLPEKKVRDIYDRSRAINSRSRLQAALK